MTIGERIAKRRIELDMTQDDLAQRTGYRSRSSINKIELGKTDLTQTKIVLFAKALATTPAYLMGWDEEVIVSFMETFYLDMLKMFEQLNEEGKEKVIEYVSDLVASGRYSKKNSKDGMVEEEA